MMQLAQLLPVILIMLLTFWGQTASQPVRPVYIVPATASQRHCAQGSRPQCSHVLYDLIFLVAIPVVHATQVEVLILDAAARPAVISCPHHAALRRGELRATAAKPGLQSLCSW